MNHCNPVYLLSYRQLENCLRLCHTCFPWGPAPSFPVGSLRTCNSVARKKLNKKNKVKNVQSREDWGRKSRLCSLCCCSIDSVSFFFFLLLCLTYFWLVGFVYRHLSTNSGIFVFASGSFWSPKEEKTRLVFSCGYFCLLMNRFPCERKVYIWIWAWRGTEERKLGWL